MDTHRFFVHRKTDNIYKYIAEDIETRLTLQTMNQTRHCQKERDGVSRKTLKELATLAAKPHSYLIDYNSVMKRILKFEDYKSCLKAIELENKMN